MEAYYEDLKHVLIPGYFLSLSLEEIEALAHSYVHQDKFVLTEKQKEILGKLEERIDQVVKEKIGIGNKFFIRFFFYSFFFFFITFFFFFHRISTRSPKDGMLFSKEMKTAVEEWLI